MTGASGRNEASKRAVEPLSVQHAINRTGKVLAARAAASQIACVKSPLCGKTPGTCAGCECSRRSSRQPSLDFGDDATHHVQAFDWKRARRGFARQHQSVAAVEHRVGDIAGFGARRARRNGHRFQHLRRGDDELARRVAGANDALFCNSGTSSGGISTPRSPRATISPSAGRDDFIQILQSLRVFPISRSREYSRPANESGVSVRALRRRAARTTAR